LVCGEDTLLREKSFSCSELSCVSRAFLELLGRNRFLLPVRVSECQSEMVKNLYFFFNKVSDTNDGKHDWFKSRPRLFSDI